MLYKIKEIRYFLVAYLIGIVIILNINSNYLLDIGFMMLFWAGLASSWNISGGYVGQFSLGHSAFVGIGAYTTALLYMNFGISPWIGMFVGGLLSVLLAIFIGVISFKMRGPFYTLVTIAFAQLIYISAIQFKNITQGSEGLPIPFNPSFTNMMFRNRDMYVLIGLTLVFILYIISVVIEKNKLGYYLVATRENEDSALALGISTKKVKITSTVLSSFLTAIMGSLYAMYILFLEPDSVLSFMFSIQPAMMSIIGGLGTAIGPILGAFILTPIDMYLRETFNSINGLNLVLYGLVLVLVMLFLPNGLISSLKKLITRLSPKIAWKGVSK